MTWDKKNRGLEEKRKFERKLFDKHQSHSVPEEKRKKQRKCERKQLSLIWVDLECFVEIDNHCTNTDHGMD